MSPVSGIHRSITSARALVGWLFVIASTSGHSQNIFVDSLKRELASAPTVERRIDLLFAIGFRSDGAQLDPLQPRWFEEAMALAVREGYEPGIALIPAVEALRAIQAQDYPKAIDRCKHSIRLLDELRMKQDLTHPLAFIRDAYNGAGLQEERLAFYTEALARYERMGLRCNMGVCYHGLGGYYLAKRQYGTAIDHYLRAKEIFKEESPEFAMNETHVVGRVYQEWGNLDRARPYLLEALTAFERTGERQDQVRVRVVLGDLEAARGDTAIANAIYREAWSRCAGLEALDRGICLSKLVHAFIWERQLDSAAHYLALLNELKSSSRMPLFSNAGTCEVEYCNYLHAMAVNDPDGALRHLQRALAAAQDNEVESLEQKYCKELARYHQQFGDPSAGLSLALVYITRSDSLQQLANRAAIAAYENQMKERDAAVALEQKQGQLDRQRQLMVGVAAFALLLIALVVVVVRSNRQKQRANQELEAARQRAEQSEKFKQQFLANMSHEIRTPMNAIMGMSGILKRNAHTPEQEKYLSAIAQSSENLLVILNDILDLSKLEAGKIDLEKVPFDPRQVIGNVRDILRFKAEEKGLSVEVSIADDVPPTLLGDPTRLNQIVLNLAGNAVKFTEQGGVTIQVSAQDKQEDHCTLMIDVTDTGIGIPQDRLDRIFEEFTQAYSDTTRKYGGTGLGLTISKRLAEMQGGGITVSSEQGRGSTFTVRVPYVMATASSDRATPAQARSNSEVELRDLRILLAEDNDFNAIVAQDELTDAIPGVQVDVAANGRIAVEMAGANDYDVILMDVQMPEMNGYDATRAIRALPGDKSRVPILAMTANVMKEELQRCREAGMDGHIPKPFKRDELMDALHTALHMSHP